MNTKSAEIFVNSLTMTEFDMIILTESWLHNGTNSGEFFDVNYFNVFRRDRDNLATSKSRGGGVLIAAHKKIQITEINPELLCENFINLQHIDILIVKVRIGYKSIYIVVLYISPGTSLEDYVLLSDSLMSINIFFESDVIILGDFNIPEFFSSPASHANFSNIVRTCNDFSSFFNLFQKNTVLNVDMRLLDLVFTNIKCEITRSPELLTREDPYHPAISIVFEVDKKKTTPFNHNANNIELNFRRANFHQLYASLCAIDFSFLDSISNVNEAVDSLYEVIFNNFRSWVPLKKLPRGNYPKWYNAEIIQVLHQKYRAWKKFKTNKNVETYDNFKTLRNKAKNLVKNSYLSYVRKVVIDVKNDPKKFWAYINGKNNRSEIPSIMTYESEEFIRPQCIVNAFSKFFRKSFAPNSLQPTTPFIKPYTDILHINQVDEETVYRAIKRLKPSLTAGPDMIPSFLIKDCATIFAKPLTVICNLILKESVFPNSWKLSRIVPIHKTGRRSEIGNYRPITLINNFAKILEIVLYSQTYPHIVSRLTPQQHGFVKGKSTVTNLFIKTQYLADCLDKRSQVDCAYADFSKAFDRINHAMLLNKLEAFGFSNSLIELLGSYLSGRSQYVYYKGYSSDTFLQSSGVPQGSVLGPLLFNIYIDDITNQLDVEYLLYADDLKLFFEIKNIEDCKRLQLNLDRVILWSTNNQLPLNKDKCFIKTYTRRKENFNFEYKIDGEILKRPQFIKDLGVTYDTEVNFIEHVRKISTSAYTSLGFVIRNSREIQELAVVKLLYYALVRPRLEYSSVVWSPIYQIHCNSLERVQRRFLKYMAFRQDGVYPCRGFSYKVLCERFEMISLGLRRQCAYVLLLHGVINNMIKCERLVAMINIRVLSHNLRFHFIFQQPIPRTNIMKSSPLYQTLESYKDIEEQVDIFCCKRLEIKKCFQV